MQTLQTLLNTNWTRPTAIYIHCTSLDLHRTLPAFVLFTYCRTGEAGMDRTGEVSGSYYMSQLGWTFAQALSYDDKCIESRNITSYSQNSLQWFV